MTTQFAALSDVLERAWQHSSGCVSERPSVPEMVDEVADLAGAGALSRAVTETLIVRICATNLPSGIVERNALKCEMHEVFAQIAIGKGNDRHGSHGVRVEDQPGVMSMRRWGLGFPAGQAEKKLTESMRLPASHAIRERRGAAGYLALWLVATR